MTLITFEQWQQWAERYTMLPYVRRYALEEEQDRPLSWEGAWKQAQPGSFVLESGKGGRYSLLGLEPVSTIRGKDNQGTIRHLQGAAIPVEGKPLELVRQWMEPYRSPSVEGLPKLLGGCVGFWGYDVIRSIERLPALAADDVPVPDYAFARFEQLWIIDHAEQVLYCAAHAYWEQAHTSLASLERLYRDMAEKTEDMKRKWDDITAVNRSESSIRRRKAMMERMQSDRLQVDWSTIAGIQADFPQESYIRAVERIQSYISAGDVFQVNLSVRQHKRLEQDPETIYEWLRLVNPSPYMGFMRFDDFQLVSGSPELLVQLEKGIVRTRPIAGTRPRGKDEAEDQRLADELIHHEKERAEHIMLVDLERNDLGRISTYGTVKVKDFMVIEKYSHVMHIVSEVEGRLAPDKQAYDVIAAAFPGGTITGAPKIRTMEIIEELEPVRRGPYTGSMGWIDYNGDMEFNIIIRTLVTANGIGYVQAGAGIVIDSVPDKEYMESVNKAKAMWKAIQYSETWEKNLV